MLRQTEMVKLNKCTILHTAEYKLGDLYHKLSPNCCLFTCYSLNLLLRIKWKPNLTYPKIRIQIGTNFVCKFVTPLCSLETRAYKSNPHVI